MATIVFTITGTNSDGTPTMTLNNQSSNGDVTCNVGDTIQWNIAPNSGVTGLCIQKTGGTDVFDGGLGTRGNSNNWSGEIANGTGGDDEEYSIAASACADENKVWHDPRITVNQ
jgi:hypothetical protein